MNKYADAELIIKQKQLNDRLKDLLILTEQVHQQDWVKITKQLIQHTADPFLFVIVGEVKAGKSSFINALLETDEEICKVAASPMTDTIQKLSYGTVHKEVDINEHHKIIYHPSAILKEISIVDTPGTNTIIEHHQEITEGFIPYSDLIVFVFEAKNPYRQSAWDFFDYIHQDWHKKTIFILQQKDLLNAEDLQANINGVQEYAEKKGVSSPIIFDVSAKMEKEGHSESGFTGLRKYIVDNITSGSTPYLKMDSNIQSASVIVSRIKDGIGLRKSQLTKDLEFREDIQETLEYQSQKTYHQVDILVENLLAAYDTSTRSNVDELKSGLAFGSILKRSFKSIFGSTLSLKNWLESIKSKLEVDLNRNMKERLQLGVVDIAENIQDMGKLISLKIQTTETILDNKDVMFSSIADKREKVLKELQLSFEAFLNHSDQYYDENIIPSDHHLISNLAAGGGIAVVGVVLNIITTMSVFEITGGIMTTVGLLFAGVSVGLQKSKIVRRFSEEIAKGRTKLQEDVDRKLKDYTKYVKSKIDQNFNAFDAHLEKESNKVEKLEGLSHKISEDFNLLQQWIKTELDNFKN